MESDLRKGTPITCYMLSVTHLSAVCSCFLNKTYIFIFPAYRVFRQNCSFSTPHCCAKNAFSSVLYLPLQSGSWIWWHFEYQVICKKWVEFKTVYTTIDNALPLIIFDKQHRNQFFFFFLRFCKWMVNIRHALYCSKYFAVHISGVYQFQRYESIPKTTSSHRL